jgi:S-adenosylmethionine-diacylgycerolhomoserine-N-methlytransferase
MTAALRQYYKHHAKIYDATRWSFLFGRRALLRSICRDCSPRRILEVGCGTGRNLAALSRLFPNARLTGVDLSEAMLRVARKHFSRDNGRVRLLQTTYDLPVAPEHPFDLVVFSYTLSMINPGWSHAIRCAAADLAPNGTVAALDFHDSPLRPFKSWMQMNHVRMDSHLLPELSLSFRPDRFEIRSAYAGIWRYFLYIGRKL